MFWGLDEKMLAPLIGIQMTSGAEKAVSCEHAIWKEGGWKPKLRVSGHH